jgi:hypothetical protein
VFLLLLPDLQRIQCRTVDPASDGQFLDGLEPAYRFPHFRADQPIDLTVIEAEFRQLLLHSNIDLLSTRRFCW